MLDAVSDVFRRAIFKKELGRQSFSLDISLEWPQNPQFVYESINNFLSGKWD